MFKDLNRILDINISFLSELMDIASDFDYSYIYKKCETLIDRMKKFDFNVVVIGQFKRGKSTLLNYFIGEELLPTGVIPITSIITKIKYGDKSRTNIIFENGLSEEIDISFIGEYISEQNNPQNIKKVDSMEVFFPSDILKGGLVLIDTPGIGSTHKHNTEVAYGHLSEADAAIFLISSDSPVGEIEIEFLMQVKKYVNKIFFIQNKIDYLSDLEIEESISFSSKVIANVIDKNLHIYPISAKLALEGKREGNSEKINKSGIKLFEDALEEFLLKDRVEYLIKSYENKAKSIVEELEGYIDFNIELLSSSIESIEEKINVLRDRLKDTKIMQKEAMVIVELELDNIIDIFSEDLAIFRKDASEKIQDKLKLLYSENKDISSKELNRLLNIKLEDEIAKALLEWNKDQEVKIKKSYEIIITRFMNKLNETIEQINDIVYALFKIRIAQAVEDFQLIDRDTFYFKFYDSSPALFAPNINDFMFLLPKKIRNRKIIKDSLKRVESELEKNGNNLKWDYVCKIRDSKYIFERVFTEHVQNVLAEIESIIKKTIDMKTKEAGNVEVEMKLYRNKKKIIRELNNTMYNAE